MPTALIEFSSKVPPRSRRGKLRGVNGLLYDGALRHRHFLLRAENAVAQDVVDILINSKREIESAIRRLADASGALTDFSLIRRDRLIALGEQIDGILVVSQRRVSGTLSSSLAELTAKEIEIQQRIMRSAIPNQIKLNIVSPSVIKVDQFVGGQLGGRRFAERFQKNFGEMSRDIQTSIGTSITLGEGIGEAQRRIRGIITNLGINRATTIARSEIQRVANEVALDTYGRNSDVIKQIQIVETLDMRTCLVCANADGTVYPVNRPGPIPPFHAGCRGFTAPITRSFQELGINVGDMPASTRASMDGQVPGALTYEQWFDQQSDGFQLEVLGPARFDAFKIGNIRIEQMVRNFRILPIADLPLEVLSI